MEIKFHHRPTQINRKNPIVVKNEGFLHVYNYRLKGDFYVRFAVVGGTSFAGLVKTDDPTNISAIMCEHTMCDIYSKKDLVNYVTDYGNMDLLHLELLYNIKPHY